ncbi:MAG: rhomboid family intramembrane serine protease [Beijerinckiaceae bacterium]
MTTNSGRSEPILLAPSGLLLLIGLMAGIHAFRALWLGLYEAGDIALLKETAFAPARLSLWLGLATPGDLLAAARARPAEEIPTLVFLLRSFASSTTSGLWTLVTHGFLHGGWDHLLINGFWMLAFGAPVMRRFGFIRFVAFFLLTVVAGGLLFFAFNQREAAILVGASGGVSGLTAAALRFAIGVVDDGRPVWRRPARPLAEALADRSVLAFMLVWLAVNLLAGFANPFGGGKIAWEAHLGGFLAGLLIFPLLDRRLSP